MEILRDFPGALSRQKNGSKTSIRALSPPWKFLKVDRYALASYVVSFEQWGLGAPVFVYLCLMISCT